MFQVIGHMFGQKNVTGIAAIHHPLGEIDSGAGDVGLLVQIAHFIDRPAVNSHANVKLGMIFEFLANFQRT
jgi:hypothetical protein